MLTVDNPASRNAFTGLMMLDLAAHVEALSKWRQGRAVLLTGAGGHFCAGADFSLAAAALAPAEVCEACAGNCTVTIRTCGKIHCDHSHVRAIAL